MERHSVGAGDDAQAAGLALQRIEDMKYDHLMAAKSQVLDALHERFGIVEQIADDDDQAAMPAKLVWPVKP